MKLLLVLALFLSVAVGQIAQSSACSVGGDVGCLRSWFNGLDASTRTAIGWDFQPTITTTAQLCAAGFVGVTCNPGGTAVVGLKITASLATITQTTIVAPSQTFRVFNFLPRMTQLQTLDFSDTGLDLSLGGSINAPIAPSLVTLNLSGNVKLIATIPSSWAQNNMKFLYLSGCKFQDVPPITVGTSTLQEVDLSENNMPGTQQLARFCGPFLQKLILSKQVASFGAMSALTQCTNLRYLDISENDFAQTPFPSQLSLDVGTTLEFLSVSGKGQAVSTNFNGKVPNEGSVFPALKTFINLQGSNLDRLPTSFFLSTNLERLELSLQNWNAFTTAQFVSQFTKLTYLHMDNIASMGQPISLSAISDKLTYLNLEAVDNLPTMASLFSTFTAGSPISFINLRRNNFASEAIPVILTQITALRKLDISKSKVGGGLPLAFSTSGITHLILNENLITETTGLPNLVAGGKHFAELKLAFNKICPCAIGEYSTWGDLTDASFGSCACEHTDCQNGCGCTNTGGLLSFPCIVRTSTSRSITRPGFYGEKCESPCHSSCFECSGPSANECKTCNNPLIPVFYGTFTTPRIDYTGSLDLPYPTGDFHHPAGSPLTPTGNTCVNCGAKENVDLTFFDSPMFETNFFYDRCTPCDAPCDTCYFNGALPQSPLQESTGGQGSCITCIPPLVLDGISNLDGGQSCVPAPTSEPTPAPTAPPCMAPNKIDGQEQHCAVVAPIRGELYVHNSQRSGTRTNIHITIIGRWGKRTAKFIDNKLTSPSEIVRRTFFGLDVGPLISFELGTFSSTNDLRYFKVVLQRMPHLIMPGLPGKPDYTVQEGPIRTFLHDTTIKPGYISLLSNQMLGPNGFSRAHSFSDPIVTPPTCSGVSCKCSVIDPNPAVAAGCYWRHNQ